MPQYGRPSSDKDNTGLYTDSSAGAVALYSKIDESAADDTDLIQSPAAPTSAVYVTHFSTMADPLTSSSHVMRTRYRKDTSGGAGLDIVAQLRQGYQSETTQGTLITTRTFSAVGASAWVTDAYTLSAAEADAITDYAELYLRVVSHQT